MAGIHDAIMDYLRVELTDYLITQPTIANPSDPAIVSVVKQGPLQGDPLDDDEARISVTIHENDRDGGDRAMEDGMRDPWEDEIDWSEEEIPSVGHVWFRRFTVKCRALLSESQELLDPGREIASCVRSRTEELLSRVNYSGVTHNGEFVCWPLKEMKAEQIQLGGPDDSYDFHFKIRFSVQTYKPNV